MGTTAYSEKADDYASHRPEYAQEAISALVDVVALDPGWTIADIGSGTGNVSKHLVDRACGVLAVEPDDAMRHKAEQILGAVPSFKSIAGSAEQTTLPEQCADLIMVGQALHWFDLSAAQAEFRRILKPGGWLALIWNRFGQQAEQDYSILFSPGEVERFSFPVTIKEAWPQFIGGARSAAGNPNQGDDAYDSFEHEQRRLFESRAVGGVIAVEYTTELVVGRLNRRTSG